MKIRLDFVTNSSSSSFIIAFKKPVEFDEETLRKYPFLRTYNNLLDKILFCEGEETTKGTVSNSKIEFDASLLDTYYVDSLEDLFNDCDYLKEVYEKSLSLFEQGYSILTKRIDYNDEVLADLIETLQNDDALIILEKD